ncbi:MAG: glycosyltransferase family 8 protein [Pseudomonadota bacterium]|nr:glycosyltransferase family 8 protein [Pseudomonadota bacterium]
MELHIPIFCATDENYAPFASMMMKSVLMHTHSFVDFYVLDGGIKKKTKRMIARDLKAYPHKSITYFDMAQYDLSQFPDMAHFSVNTFSRYFIPELVPHLEKIIYLDVDMTIKKDIKELFDQDLDGYPLGAMAHTPTTFMSRRLRDCTWSVYHEDSAYFNAGMLVMNIPKLIQMNFTDEAIKLTHLLREKLIFPDQDVLNIMFENNYKILDFRFNYVNYIRWRKEIRNIDPVVVHHCSLKPWKENSIYQQDFEDILQQSVFYDHVFKTYRSHKVRYYLFGKIPLCTKYVPKAIFLNQSFFDRSQVIKEIEYV